MKQKICIIDYDMSVRGGVEQVTVNLSSELADDYEVHLISLCQQGDLVYKLDSRVKYTVLLEREQRLREMRRNSRLLLIDYFRRNGIDVAIIQGNYSGFIVSSVRGLVRTKLIFCDHGALMNQWDRKDIVAIRLISALLSHKVVTLTKQSRDAYCKKFHLPSKRVVCIYNWIDPNQMCSTVYATDSHRIVSAGRFGKEKGFDLLVKAFCPVAKKHPDWHLDLFGDGEMMETVKELISQYGLENNIHLMGMRSDLQRHYGDYAMYVLPSYREGMPLVLLEAKANKLPIVSFDIMTGPREIVRNGIDGILVPPYDLEKMSAAICTLIEDDMLRQTMSDRSLDNLNKFSKDTILKQWCNLIESV